MIYFDNAATGGFKPRTVFDATENVMHYLSANPGRSGHRLSVTGGKIVYDCRKELAELFDAQPERVVFTKNCTEALNLAIFGAIKEGGTVITTTFEHNSVIRPLKHLENTKKINLKIAAPSESKTLYEDIERLMDESVKFVVMTAVSNVTGEVLPFKDVYKLCKSRGVKLILDGAQAAGHIPLSVKTDADAIAVPGHKGLYGIMGSGALILSENFEVSPLLFGGTGTSSKGFTQPSELPERLESGTLALPAIAALSEGVRFVKANSAHFKNVLEEYTEKLISGLADLKVTVYSKPNPAGIVAFKVKDIASQDFADMLNEYDAAVRGGLHCSPLTHSYLNTLDDGLIRASLAPQNTSREIRYFLQAVSEIISR